MTQREREASWYIVFCRNIKLPSFGCLHDAIKIDRREICTIDVADASFRFCDKYNTYALHHLRSVISFGARCFPEQVEFAEYVITITLSGATARATDMSGELVLEHAINKSVKLHELQSMVEYATGKFNVRFVLTNGEVPHRRLHDAALRPGTELCAMQAQFQQDDRVFAERARVAAERQDNEKREEEQVANEAELLGHSGALRRLT